ncbi:MAG: DegT/DnrJ/EryC1/StrS family aminotransferase [Acutalibacteraceae bacterium]
MKIIPFSPPDITDLEIGEVIDALKSGWITTGYRTKLFEKKLAEYIGTSRVVTFGSCTSALELTLKILGVGPGDEVITTAYTYTASASVIYHLGAKIVLVDTLEDSFLIDPKKVEQAITDKTKAIIPVNIGGKLCNYDEIYKAAENKKHLFKPCGELQKAFGRPVIISDSAHGLGAVQNGKNSGQIADFTAFSFHAVKNLTTAEGGAITWKDFPAIDNEWLANLFTVLSLHGQTKDAYAKTRLGAWEYDIIYPAYKCNMTDLQAAIGLKQLERYDSLLKRREEIVNMYDEAFLPMGLKPLIHKGKDYKSSFHLYMLQIPGYSPEQRNQLIDKLAENGIAANVHYKPLPMFTAYKNLGFKIEDYPNAYKHYCEEITLPLHTLLTDEDVEFIIETIKNEI